MGRYGQVYDPNVSDKKYIAMLAVAARAECRSDQITGDLMACMTFYFSDARRRDLDNLIKIIMDALNNVLYKDDSQIIKIIASKQRCPKNTEHTEIEIFPITA